MWFKNHRWLGVLALDGDGHRFIRHSQLEVALGNAKAAVARLGIRDNNQLLLVGMCQAKDLVSSLV